MLQIFLFGSVYFIFNLKILSYLLQIAVEFSQISLSPPAVVFNSCSKAAWELRIAVQKPPANLCTFPRRL
jgi:hypothetical protein